MAGKTSKCFGCGKFLSSAGVATCTCAKCLGVYHKACVSLPEGPVGRGWVCPECTTRTRKDDDTPLKPAMPGPAAVTAAVSTSGRFGLDLPGSCGRTTSPATSPGAPGPALDMQGIHKEFAEWMMEMREFRQEMVDFKGSLKGLSSRIDSIELRLQDVEQRNHEPHSELADLRNKVLILEQELKDRDQDDLLSDLEIGHLPEEKGESVVHTVTVLAAKLGVTLEERDIVFAERVGVAQGAGSAGELPRPRRIVVRLARRGLRDSLLQGARVRRSLTTTDAGYAANAGPRAARIFINERLTRHNRLLFFRTREECKKAQWRFAWTKRGRVFARQADGKQVYPIRSEADLCRVFGPGSV